MAEGGGGGVNAAAIAAPVAVGVAALATAVAAAWLLARRKRRASQARAATDAAAIEKAAQAKAAEQGGPLPPPGSAELLRGYPGGHWPGGAAGGLRQASEQAATSGGQSGGSTAVSGHAAQAWAGRGRPGPAPLGAYPGHAGGNPHMLAPPAAGGYAGPMGALVGPPGDDEYPRMEPDRCALGWDAALGPCVVGGCVGGRGLVAGTVQRAQRTHRRPLPANAPHFAPNPPTRASRPRPPAGASFDRPLSLGLTG